MKKIYFSLLSLIVTSILTAQPVVSSTDLHTGLSFDLYDMSNVNTDDLFPSGANITWDISDATATLTGTANFLEMSDTPLAADYPEANFAIKFTSLGGESSYSLFNFTESVFEEVAKGVGTANAVSFSNYRTSLVFPFTYNFSNTDTYQKENQEVKTIVSTYDAYGTFSTSGATNSDVIRLMIDDDDNTSIFWWKSNPLEPLFQGSSDGFVLWESASTGINESYTNALFTIYPNPATNELHILNKKLLTKIEIFNALGQLELSTTNSLVDISMLRSGVYILRAQSENGNASQKFIKN